MELFRFSFGWQKENRGVSLGWCDSYDNMRSNDSVIVFNTIALNVQVGEEPKKIIFFQIYIWLLEVKKHKIQINHKQ